MGHIDHPVERLFCWLNAVNQGLLPSVGSFNPAIMRSSVELTSRFHRAGRRKAPAPARAKLSYGGGAAIVLETFSVRTGGASGVVSGGPQYPFEGCCAAGIHMGCCCCGAYFKSISPCNSLA